MGVFDDVIKGCVVGIDFVEVFGWGEEVVVYYCYVEFYFDGFVGFECVFYEFFVRVDGDV